MKTISMEQVLESPDLDLRNVATHARGPAGALPLTAEMLLTQPSGNLFGLTMNAGMGWDPARLAGPEVLILSTHGGLRAPDGSPIALGFHTGHWEVGLLVAEAARELKALHAIPFAGAVTDPCDGRTQGTTGMLDSLPYRNDAAIVLRRLMRSLPTRAGVLGVATCDKGLPAMLMALASSGDLPSVLIPGGVTLLPEDGEDAGKIQTIGARFSQGQITLEYAADVGCRACATPGGGCQFLGTAATSQVVAEALGLALPHTALAPSGQPVWLDAAKRSAAALLRLREMRIGTGGILSQSAFENAMVVYAAFGGSTNLLLHLPAIAHAAGRTRPTVADWMRINREVPRLVDALPNGPGNFATVQVFLAGGVPEVMLHLRGAGLLHTTAMTAAGVTLGECLDWWQQSERRLALRQNLRDRDGIDPGDVIFSPSRARAKGLTSTVCFPHRQPRPRRLRRQEHRHRSDPHRRRRHLPSSRPSASLYSRNHRHRRHSPRSHRSRRCNRPDLLRPQRRRHAGDLPDHRGLESLTALPSRGAPHRRPLQRRLHRPMHWPYFARSARWRPHRKSS